MNLISSIEEAISQSLPTAYIEIRDPYQDGQHLEAIVVAREFEGQPLFKQHQVVMRSLRKHFEESLHALQLQTYTPTEWEKKQKEDHD